MLGVWSQAPIAKFSQMMVVFDACRRRLNGVTHRGALRKKANTQCILSRKVAPDCLQVQTLPASEVNVFG